MKAGFRVPCLLACLVIGNCDKAQGVLCLPAVLLIKLLRFSLTFPPSFLPSPTLLIVFFCLCVCFIFLSRQEGL